MNEKIMRKIEELDALEEQRRELYSALKKSLELERLAPECFEYGSATVRVVGNVHREMRFIVTAGDGTEKVFDLGEVPTYLWPTEVRRNVFYAKSPSPYKKYLARAAAQDGEYMG